MCLAYIFGCCFFVVEHICRMDFGISAIIAIAIVAAAAATAAGTGKATTEGIEKRETRKHYLQALLYQPVYIRGISFESAKALYPEEARRNPKLFEQYYNEYRTMRAADMESETHPLVYEKNEPLYQRYLALGIVVVLLLIISNIYD
jgi:hypothetical protein